MSDPLAAAQALLDAYVAETVAAAEAAHGELAVQLRAWGEQVAQLGGHALIGTIDADEALSAARAYADAGILLAVRTARIGREQQIKRSVDLGMKVLTTVAALA